MRPDLEIIQQWIQPNSKVLDLGCGDGSLLHYLQTTKNVHGIGLEIDETNIQHCLDRGTNVIEQNLDKGLSNFQSGSFDTVLLAQTLQALSKPDHLIDEMLRIGKNGIVTFPNFGNWKSRLYLASRGRMPVSKFIPHSWYNTPNIHMCTIKDFFKFSEKMNFKIFKSFALMNKSVSTINSKNLFFKNLFCELGIFLIEKQYED